MLIADGSEVAEGKNNTFEDAETNLPDLLTRSKASKSHHKRFCFICDEFRTVDDEPYNQGDLRAAIPKAQAPA